MACVGVSVIVPVAFLLFNVRVCLDCDWLCGVVWFGNGCVFLFLMCRFVCELFFFAVFVLCVRFVCEVLCVVVWFACCCDLCCVCVCVFNCVFCAKYVV